MKSSSLLPSADGMELVCVDGGMFTVSVRWAMTALFRDYFANHPTYEAVKFRRRFKMKRELFLSIVDYVCAYDSWFVQRLSGDVCLIRLYALDLEKVSHCVARGNFKTKTICSLFWRRWWTNPFGSGMHSLEC